MFVPAQIKPGSTITFEVGWAPRLDPGAGVAWADCPSSSDAQKATVGRLGVDEREMGCIRDSKTRMIIHVS